MRNLYIIISLFLSYSSYSQKIDNTASYRDLGPRYLRFHYDNDFFAANDYYYTQGYNFELTSPALKKNPLGAILIHLKDSPITYGLALEHYGFTPTSIRHDEILINDRPFSSCIMLKSFSVSVNKMNKERLSSILSTGMIGPIAFGKEMQKTIHKWIGGVEPYGWQHQIKNGIIINYDLNYEKEMFDDTYFQISSIINLRLGTLNTKSQAGLLLILGKPETLTGKKYKLNLYTQPLINLVAYDATLQGNLYNNSPYIIAASQIKRVNFQNNFGLLLRLNKLSVEYSRTIIGKEFKTGKRHQWGGFRIGYRF